MNYFKGNATNCMLDIFKFIEIKFVYLWIEKYYVTAWIFMFKKMKCTLLRKCRPFFVMINSGNFSNVLTPIVYYYLLYKIMYNSYCVLHKNIYFWLRFVLANAINDI